MTLTTLHGPDARSTQVEIIRETPTSFVVRDGDGEEAVPKTYWRRAVAHDREDIDRPALAAWFLAAEPALPRNPFDLFPWVEVSDPERAYAAWRSVLEGEPGALTDGAFRDLARLRELFGKGHGS
jgi:hypothetical protein